VTKEDPDNVMTADQIRSTFLSYFEARGHRVVKSSSLVPQNDPTLLFANAGMNQFKSVFLGQEQRPYSRATSAQKCVRAGGKHNDLENVGRTGRHHTFFEMLGNFSFGDYFKADAIAFAWELLTTKLGLPPDRLTVTVFRGEENVPRDAEAGELWRKHVPPERILELGAKDNFWAMGETGPCGPCSEVHYFQGNDLPCVEEQAGGTCRGVECECDRWLEIWNLVFMQYDRDGDGRLAPLPAPCIDTGMGLERVAAVIQGHRSNYDSDLFTPLLAAVGKLSGHTYGARAEDDTSMRVIADHLRAMTFLIADGVLPGNEGRGYVLRKIMRRAMRHGKNLGLDDPFLHSLTASVIEHMGPAYPELFTHRESVGRVVRIEEERFGATLRQAVSVFDEIADETARRDATTIAGADAFRLYDTYGLALDFTEELARERGLAVDQDGFARELAEQQNRARSASRLGSVTGDPVYVDLLSQGRTEFLGYQTLAVDDARIVALVADSRSVPSLDAGQRGEVILDRTPFYAEAGGQLGDRGVISAEGCAAQVEDCVAPVPGLHVHRVLVAAGRLEVGMIVGAEVEPDHRAGNMRHHTGTHLLHAALRETLGLHVKQAGSLVAPDRLRFDFSHYAPVSLVELRHIENRVNEQILLDTPLRTQVMSREDALAYGALAFFGDKYGERVRVVEVGDYSKEFCGGTHVSRSGEIGLLLVSNEQGISAGTRRIEALAGNAAVRHAQANEAILDDLERSAKVDRPSLVDEYARLREQLKAAQREVDRLKLKAATAAGTDAGGVTSVAGVNVWTPRFDALDRKAHAAVVDDFRNKQRDGDYLGVSMAVTDETVSVIAVVSPRLSDRVKAPEIMKRLGLRGGGRPDFAQGGGVQVGEVAGLQQRASELLTSLAREVNP
jgi:alanyl-tRNA synthetase